MIKSSITRKITLIIIAIMLVATVISWIGSGIFLEKYYNNKKQNAIKKVYNILKDVEDDNDDEISEAGRNTLDIACDRYGASLIVMDVSNNILSCLNSKDNKTFHTSLSKFALTQKKKYQ